MRRAPAEYAAAVTQPEPARRSLTVVQLIPALDSGGAERTTLEIARALVRSGHRAVVISAGGRLTERLLAEGGEHIALPIGRKSPVTLAQVLPLRRTLGILQPDIVHARSRLPAWLALLAMRGLRPRPHLVTTVHGLNSPGAWSSVMIRGERVIAVSQTVRDHLQQHYPDLPLTRLRVIPRGVDPDEFPYGYRPDGAWRTAFFAEFPQLADAPLLTLPGRGTRLKGHAAALNLLAALHARGIPARLLLLGCDEPQRAAYVRELRQQAQALGIAAAVAITPPRADVREVLAISDLVLQLSRKPEAFGRTVLEAIALCRPVLGWSHGGVGELLAELYPAGRVPPGDLPKLVERAAELLRLAPPIAPLHRYRLADMQQATLAVYRELVPVLDEPGQR